MIHSADIRRLKDEAQLRAVISERDSEIQELKERLEALTIKVEMLQEFISFTDDKYNSKTNNNE
tara:strand:- start:173 stop:364 length:192 start_codon:yes stop_codon:yes gene_type:complete